MVYRDPPTVAEVAQDPMLEEYGLLPEQKGRAPKGSAGESWDDYEPKSYDNIWEEYADDFINFIDSSEVKSVNADAVRQTAQILKDGTKGLGEALSDFEKDGTNDEKRKRVINLIERIPKVGQWQEVVKHFHRQWITGAPFVPHFIHERKPDSPEYKESKKDYEKKKNKEKRLKN